MSTATAMSWQEWALVIFHFVICDIVANFHHVMTVFLVMVKVPTVCLAYISGTKIGSHIL